VGVTPAGFAVKWAGSTQTERAAGQDHFIDLCRMLGVPTPNEADPTGADHAFEKGAEKVGGGFADVEARPLHLRVQGQAQEPEFRLSATAAVQRGAGEPAAAVRPGPVRGQRQLRCRPDGGPRLTLADLLEAPEEPLRVLRAVMVDPEALRPGKTREELTGEAAEQFASLAQPPAEAGLAARRSGGSRAGPPGPELGLPPRHRGGGRLAVPECGRDDPT
jgi:hypothetical protein